MSQGKIIVANVEEVPPRSFPWGNIRWLYHGHLAADAEMTFGVVTLDPGQEYPLHSHGNCEEIMYVLKGHIRYLVNGAEHELGPGSLIRTPKDAHHHAINAGEEKAVMTVVYSHPIRQTQILKTLPEEPGASSVEG